MHIGTVKANIDDGPLLVCDYEVLTQALNHVLQHVSTTQSSKTILALCKLLTLTMDGAWNFGAHLQVPCTASSSLFLTHRRRSVLAHIDKAM